jgi:hypothetical protein
MTASFNYSDCFQGNIRSLKVGHDANHCESGYILSPLKIEGAYTIFYDNYTTNTYNFISARAKAERHSLV